MCRCERRSGAIVPEPGAFLPKFAAPGHHRADHSTGATAMSERADALRRQLIRNFDDVPKQRELRPPLYDTECARLGAGTAAPASA